jgi:hypothetical protein
MRQSISPWRKQRGYSQMIPAMQASTKLITLHNANVRSLRNNLTSSSITSVRKFNDANGGGIISTICCGSKKISVKTFKDETFQVVEEN